MQAAERGAGKNTLDAYRNDLADLTAHLRAAGSNISERRHRRLARISQQPRRARLQGLVAGAAAVGGAPALSFSLRGRKTRRRSGRGAGRPKRARTLPKVLSIAEVDGLLAQARSDMRRRRSAARRSACARRGCCACSKWFTPPACASPNWWRCRPRARGAISACWWCAARAARSGWCRSTRPPSAPWPSISSCAPRRNATKSKWLFPSFGEQGHLTRQHFARELKSARRRQRHRAGAPEPARAAPCLCQPSAA